MAVEMIEYQLVCQACRISRKVGRRFLVKFMSKKTRRKLENRIAKKVREEKNPNAVLVARVILGNGCPYCRRGLVITTITTELLTGIPRPKSGQTPKVGSN